MEIRPTKLTTQILTTIINQKPQAYACVLGNHMAGTVCFYSYYDGVIMIYEMKGLPQNDKNIFNLHIYEGTDCDQYMQNKMDQKTMLKELPPLFSIKGTAWGIIYLGGFIIEHMMKHMIVIEERETQEAIACGPIKPFV